MLDTLVYQSIFAGSPIGAYILSPSDDPVILDVNEAFLRNVAYSRSNWSGSACSLPCRPRPAIRTTRPATA